jgi:hypothetical protein
MEIREFGRQIAVDHKPESFYVFTGTEYGVKRRYIEMISDIYGKKPMECETVGSVLSMMSGQHIIQPEPMLYIVRYDDSFLKSLTKESSDTIKNTNIIGTIVVLYDADSSSERCEKYLPDCTVRFDAVSKDLIRKYLMQDFKDMTLAKAEIAAFVGKDYSGSSLASISLTNLDSSVSDKADPDEIRRSLSAEVSGNITRFKSGIAARDFNYCTSQLDYMDDLPGLLYAILSTMLDIEKAIELPKSKLWCSKYAKNWTKYDIVMMFENTYSALLESRSVSGYDVRNALVYLLAAMRFSPIPAVR